MFYLPKFLLISLLLLLGNPLLRAQKNATLLERFVAIFQPVPATAAVDTTVATVNQENLPITEKYADIYNLIHREQQEYYRKLSDSSYVRWDELNQLTNTQKSYNGDTTVVLAKNFRVFGWYPHWMGSAYKTYPFHLLSHVALFSYNVNVAEEGEPYDNPDVIDGWKSDDFELVDLAHEHNCKVMITVTNFGAKQNADLLSNIGMQDRLITDLLEQLHSIDADGIDLDFELLPWKYSKQLSGFVRELKKQLDAAPKAYELSVVLPKKNVISARKSTYNLDTLQRYVDFFTLTAYDFKTKKSGPGPIAPLYNSDGLRRSYGSIEDVVFNYLEEGLDPKKLLLGLPYYGGKWTTYQYASGSDSTVFEHLTYAAIKKLEKRLGPPKYDKQVWAASYTERSEPVGEPYSSVEEQVWFDDTLTLNVKYDWVLEQELGGIGLWALGYDQARPELWGLIDNKFAFATDTIIRYDPAREAYNLPMQLYRYRDPLILSGLFVFLFMGAGFIAALFDWRVREVFYQNKTLRIFYIAAAFTLLTATVAVILFLNPKMIGEYGAGPLALFTLVVGLVLGGVLVRQIGAWFSAGRSRTP